MYNKKLVFVILDFFYTINSGKKWIWGWSKDYWSHRE